jgi:hypothetical protein
MIEKVVLAHLDRLGVNAEHNLPPSMAFAMAFRMFSPSRRVNFLR